MRRLPIFFCIDVSESMIGENLYKLEEAIGAIVSSLRKDPYALETALLSVIVFAGKARTVTQLAELSAFHPPELPVGGGTALGAGLDRLMNEIDRTVATTTPERKGDWKPIIFLLTDGHPTDDVSKAVRRWDGSYRHRAHLVAVSIGGGGDHALLTRLTEAVVVFDDAAPDAFARFTEWISLSIQNQSRSVSAGQDTKLSLAKVEPSVIAHLNAAACVEPREGIDDRYAVFVGKCEKKKLPYVVKYKRQMNKIQTRDPVLSQLLEARRYLLDSAVPVKNSYFDLSDGMGSGQCVGSEELSGQPSCPHCAARFAMAVCECGRIHCVAGDGEHTCPWCLRTGLYGSGDGRVGFGIGRERG